MNPTGKVLKLEGNGKLLWFSPVDDDLTIDELIKKFDRPKYVRTYQPFKPITVSVQECIDEFVKEVDLDSLFMNPDELNIKAYERGWCL